MKLSALIVQNYKCIGNTPCVVKIDNIVILIGQNNSGKSTVLDAYEAFASSGKELDEHDFHNGEVTLPVKITGVFSEITKEDEDVIGSKWKYTDEQFGECIKVRWVWIAPNKKGQKESYCPETNAFIPGGVGGWDSLIISRIPEAIRIRPTDPIEMTQTKILGILKDYVKEKLKENSESTKSALEAIRVLTDKICEDTETAFGDVSQKINDNISRVFPGASINIVTRSKNPLDEKVIAADSYISVGTKNNYTGPLLNQGSGLQRVLLWSALSVMAETNKSKKKTKVSSDLTKKILLIDEPEAFLHPPMVRSAREALYDFAENNENWQVIATTHSPIFIDVSKKHTTIVRVDIASESTQHYISTDDVTFNEDERTKLQMIRACNPVVNEFFFHDNIVLVEGPTEQLTVLHVAGELSLNVHVIDCKGKANIPLFVNILNHFKIPFIVIHDSDSPKIRKKTGLSKNPAWTINEKIRNAVQEGCFGNIYTQFPHFEGEFFDEELTSGKVDNILSILSSKTGTEYDHIFDVYSKILKRVPEVLTDSLDCFDTKKNEYIARKGLGSNELWYE